MTPSGRNPVVTSLTLAGAAVAAVVMAIVGVNALTAPFGDDDPASASGPQCAPEDQQVEEFVYRADVTVSVYNTGKRKGRAQVTQEKLESVGFKAGEIGNGGKGDKVKLAEVRTTKADDPKAQLVANAFGRNTRIVVTEEAYGPGVDVFIGDDFERLVPGSPRKIRLEEPKVTCD